MSRPAITPTDKGLPNPDWRYSQPKPVDDLGGCEIDASQITLVHEQYRLAGVSVVTSLSPPAKAPRSGWRR